MFHVYAQILPLLKYLKGRGKNKSKNWSWRGDCTLFDPPPPLSAVTTARTGKFSYWIDARGKISRSFPQYVR